MYNSSNYEEDTTRPTEKQDYELEPKTIKKLSGKILTFNQSNGCNETHNFHIYKIIKHDILSKKTIKFTKNIFKLIFVANNKL